MDAECQMTRRFVTRSRPLSPEFPWMDKFKRKPEDILYNTFVSSMLSSRSTKTSPGRIFICLNINNWLIETKTLSNFFLDDGYQLVQRLLTRAGCRIWPPDVPRWNQRQRQSSRWRCWCWCWWWGGPAGGCRTCTGVSTGTLVQWQGSEGWYWSRCAAAKIVLPYWPMLNLTLLSCHTAIL